MDFNMAANGNSLAKSHLTLKHCHSH